MHRRSIDDGRRRAVHGSTLVIWTVLLGVVVFVLLPALIYRARRLVVAARSIDRAMAATLTTAASVVGNTEPTRGLLGQTIDAAGSVLAAAGQIDAHSAAVEGLLAGRATVRS